MFGGRIGRTDEEEGEEHETEREGEAVRGAVTDVEDMRDAADKEMKPVFMKGLFSVATTTTKSACAIKTDLRKHSSSRARPTGHRRARQPKLVHVHVPLH